LRRHRSEKPADAGPALLLHCKYQDFSTGEKHFLVISIISK
jgi:hypothetical protein